MNLTDRPRLGKGVRLHRDRDGGAMLLVPEGTLMLNPSAAAALDLVDGKRTVGEIAAALVAEFEVDEPNAQVEICGLLARLAERRFVEAP